MHDTEFLFVVLAAIYLAECFFLIGRGGAIAHAWFPTKWRLTLSRHLYGVREGVLFPGNPLPPLGTAFVCQSWPVALSPMGIVSLQHPRMGQPEKSGISVCLWRELDRISLHGKKLYVNGKFFIKTDSIVHARYLVEIIEKLRIQNENDREACISRQIELSLSREEIGDRLTGFNSKSPPLRILANLLFANLFIFFPLLVYHLGVDQAWPKILAVLFLNLGFILPLHHRTHRSLYDRFKEERWSQFLIMLFSPPAAIRVIDFISRDLLARFHILAICEVLCSREIFINLASRTMRELRFPIPRDRDSRHQDITDWFYAKQIEMLTAWLIKMDMDPTAIQEEPAPRDENVRTYCPRCLRQFLISEGMCRECGQRLIPFA